MDFSLYGDDSKGLIRLDPRTKLFVFLCSMLMSINTYSNMMIMIYAFAICALLALCGEPWMALRSACLYTFMVYLRQVVGMSGTSAPVVVLDEATAFIDPENEKKMNEAVSEIIRGKSVIVIAHKLSSVRDADKIILLGEGKILQEGTHEELLESSEVYRQLWNASESAGGWQLRERKEGIG